MLSRRDLFRIGAASFAVPVRLAEGAGLSTSQALERARERPKSLAGLAAKTGRLFGTSLNVWDMSDTDYLAAIAQDCSILVAENALKANQYRPAPDRFDFSGADIVIDFATRNGMAFRGHTLCWFNSVPKWVSETITSRDDARRELLAEVREPCLHLAGRVQSWDVVNEVLRPDDGQEFGLRRSFWQEKLGPEFIDLAFHAAREADPSALLCLNEMDLEYDHSYFETKRQALLRLLKRLIASGVPIHAVGIQCHLQYVNISKFPFSKDVFHRLLSDIAELGLKVIISEMDVPDRNLPADLGQRDTIIANSIGDLLSVATNHPAVIAIVTWCLTDRYSWMNKDAVFRRSDNLPSRGALLDGALKPKAAYWSVFKALDTAAPLSP